MCGIGTPGSCRDAEGDGLGSGSGDRGMVQSCDGHGWTGGSRYGVNVVRLRCVDWVEVLVFGLDRMSHTIRLLGWL